ncbi:hypothetical protein OJJOAM_000156 [Cupriavidus sp. H18C1]
MQKIFDPQSTISHPASLCRVARLPAWSLGRPERARSAPQETPHRRKTRHENDPGRIAGLRHRGRQRLDHRRGRPAWPDCLRRQPALARLEDKLATALLRRTTRRLELTEEGAALLAHARAILGAVDQAEDQIALRRQKPAGKLRINAASPFMLHVVVPLVDDFRRAYPEIELELHSSDQIIDLLEHRTDVAIRIGALRDSTLHARPLCHSRLRVLASPAYLKAHGRPRSVGELARHSLLGFTQPDSLNRWPLRDEAGNEFEITPAVSASSGETLRQLALAGQGVVCLADFMTAQDRARGDLVQLFPPRDARRAPAHPRGLLSEYPAVGAHCLLSGLPGGADAGRRAAPGLGPAAGHAPAALRRLWYTVAFPPRDRERLRQGQPHRHPPPARQG